MADTGDNPPRKTGSIEIQEYVAAIAGTDELPKDDIRPVLLGLFGEVGEMMATVKKVHREREAYVGHARAATEELGDTLWYFATLCGRLGISLDELFLAAAEAGKGGMAIAAHDTNRSPISRVPLIAAIGTMEDELIHLGEDTAALLSVRADGRRERELMSLFANSYLRVVHASGLSFAGVARNNIEKTVGRFCEPDPAKLPDFDCLFKEEEQLPREFRIEIVQRESGKTNMRWNGVFIGDPLTDNIRDPDDYRFHDVFHFAYASILHWSPVVRALLKQKRKSDAKSDEEQDGGRAIVVEEGLTAWIFSCAKQVDFFANRRKLPFDLLKTVGEFIAGYEVEQCPLKLWERAILDGYEVFRQIRDAKRGIIVGNRSERTISFEPL